MCPRYWASDDQLVLLRGRVSGYLESKAIGEQISFFAKLDEEWFRRWPEELECNVPLPNSGVALTPEQAATLGEAIGARKKVSF
jgi:hypothetical protein